MVTTMAIPSGMHRSTGQSHTYQPRQRSSGEQQRTSTTRRLRRLHPSSEPETRDPKLTQTTRHDNPTRTRIFIHEGPDCRTDGEPTTDRTRDRQPNVAARQGGTSKGIEEATP
ncbi:hypothetical protein LIA77_08143 [Sarocladium implicatum]|nr:hypothetical protein LIA77_08143 [Sarocladium implicatum]